MNALRKTTTQEGFTIPELLVTLIVVALFITIFFELFSSISTASMNQRFKALADNTAYSMLKRYSTPSISPTAWFTCDTDTGTNNDNDVVVNGAANGTTIKSGTLTRADTGLPEPISYTINALAIYGCAGANAGKPIRLQITLSYGSPSKTITHAMLIGY